MTICEIIVLAVLGGFAVLGIIIGLFRGAIKATVRGLIILGCVAVAVIFNKQITGFIFSINIQGQTLEEMLKGLMTIDGAGVDPNTISDLLWPIILITAQIIVCIVSIVGLVEASWLVVLIFDLILKIPLRNKKKFRLIGALIGLVSGGLVGLAVDSLYTGLAPNLYKVYKLEIGDTKVSEIIPIEEDKIIASGIETFNAESGSFAYKLGSLLNPLVYNRVSVAKITDSDGVEKTYTFDGQINAIVKIANLAGTFSQIGSVDLSDPESVDNLIEALNNLDFNNLSEEERETIDTLIESFTDIIGSETGMEIEITTEILAATNFEVLGDVLDVAATVEAGEAIEQDDVTKVLEDLLIVKEGSEMNTAEAIAATGLDVSNFTENPEVADLINDSIDELENKVDENGDRVYTPEEIQSLRDMFFGTEE